MSINAFVPARFRFLIFALSLLPLGGCVNRLITPPTRINVLEAPKTLGRNGNSLSASGSLQGGVFDLQALDGMLLYKRGLTDRFDAGLSLSRTHVQGVSQYVEPIDPNLWSLHAEGKYAPALCGDYCAALVGAGWGHSDLGSFDAFDAGFTLGYSDWKIVPTLTEKAMLNIPVNPREVHVARLEGDPGVARQARTTYGFETLLGLRAPIWPRPVSAPPTLAVEASYAWMYDGEGPRHIFGVSAGLEFPFGK